jgi:tRNA modification GTPase
VVHVHAKADLGSAPGTALNVSALTGQGMTHLLKALTERAGELLPAPDELTTNVRQRSALADALHHIDAAEQQDDLLLVAEELRQARLAFDTVTGRAGVENMLDALFGRFCIGK